MTDKNKKPDADKPADKKKRTPGKKADKKPKSVNNSVGVNKMQTNPETGLTDQQEQFFREYLTPQGKDSKPFNGKQAAIRAGYSPKTAAQQASRLLTNVNGQAFLAKLQEPAIRKFEVTQERIMEEVAHLAFSNIMDYVTIDDNGQAFIDLSTMTRQQAAALAQIEVIELPPQEGMTVDEKGEPQAYSREVLKVKIKMWDKLNALEKLMKRHGLLKEQIEISGKVELTSTELARRMAFMLRSAAEQGKK